MSDPVKELTDILCEGKIGILFWTCPRGCRGIVEWTEKDKPKPIATCKVCGTTNLSSPPPAPTHAGEHSPEPWTINASFPSLVFDANGILISTTGHTESRENNSANAARIVACVNFCAGVSSEELQNVTAKFLQLERDNLANKLRAQLAENASDFKAFWADYRKTLGVSSCDLDWDYVTDIAEEVWNHRQKRLAENAVEHSLPKPPGQSEEMK